MRKVFSFFGRMLGRVLFNSKMVVVLLVIAAGSAGTAYYYYHQNQKTLVLLNNPNQASAEEVKDLTGKVSKLMDLPSGETPTAITVTDKTKLKDQPFFKNAENGDKVLVYTQAQKAIMYRPASDKIIEVGPVQITPNQTFKTAIYYSAGSADAADSITKTLKDKVSNLDIADKVAAKGTYSKTLVVDIKGDKSAEVKQLADLINGQVGTLPADEAKPDADFLVIAVK